MADVTRDRAQRAPFSLAQFLHLHMAEVWVRFLVALLGLILAFAAALFSTLSRESGELWATVILASTALLMAAIVGLTTVPYLVRRVATARVREVFDYDVTRIGVIYILVAVVIGIAALNTGNNLLYIIVAAMLAAILVSGVASAVVLRELRLDVRVPEHVFAGHKVSGRFVLRNPRRWLPSFSVSVVPPRTSKRGAIWRWQPATFAFPFGRTADRQWIRLPDRRLRRVTLAPPPTHIFDGAVYFAYIPPRGESSADLALRFDRRGRYHQDSFGLATRFPFSFLTKTRHVPLAKEVIVYPSVEQTDELLEVLPLITGEFETFVRGRGYDLYRIREYMPEDSARHVDWKATARSGSPKVREFTREDERKLRIVFDNPAPGIISADTYERMVALAASLAWHFQSEDTDLSFVSQEFTGSPDLHHFLTHLAIIEPQRGESVVDTLPASESYNLILTARPRGTIPTALWACSYCLFMGDQ